MKYKIMTMALAAFALAACSKEEPILTHKDWEGTTEYYAAADETGFNTYYSPAVGYCGDPMPFFDPVAQNFKVMYLQEFRPNKAMTYHPIWCVETNDAASYTSLGELIAYGGAAEQDAALGTGSTVYNEADKTYYCFYTGHAANKTNTGMLEAVMLATSKDFKTWTKDRTLLISGKDGGYSLTDFRDPCLFKGDDGMWHMVVATYRDSKGVLAEYISSDLRQWQSNGLFCTVMWDRFYECPDIFKMGSWWYLVYSDKTNFMRKVQYFKGATLEALKDCVNNDHGWWPDDHEGFLDSRGFYAGKTASNGTDRYIWGWCPTRKGSDNTNVGASPEEPEWAGALVAHRLVQHDDGTLTLGSVPAIEAKYKEVKTYDNFSLKGDAFKLMPRLGRHNLIKLTVKTKGNEDRFGISLCRGSDSQKWYTLMVNPEGPDRRKINFEEEGGKGFIGGIDGYLWNRPADNTYHITITTDNSVMTMYVNDVAAYTNRIYNASLNCWSLNTYGSADIEVTQVSVSRY